jgi:hypothetical protein
MTTRRELTEAVGERYRRSDRNDKRQIPDEFVQLTGYHRKHAIRVLCREPQPPKAKPGPQRRYDGDVRAALITLWEAADRICGKRLKALIPTLIDSMTRHGHLSLPKDLRQRLKQIFAATIDRLLRDVREQAFGARAATLSLAAIVASEAFNFAYAWTCRSRAWPIALLAGLVLR